MDKSILSPTFLTFTLGCRVNQAETADLENQLVSAGVVPYQSVSTYRYINTREKPFLVLINTCAVTKKAEIESQKTVRHFKKLYPKSKVIALGCAADFISQADLVVKNEDKENSVRIIFQNFSNLASASINNKQLTISNQMFISGRALIKIQDGCNNFCSYCIVPFLRGKPKSIPQKETICKINKLVNLGIKEITLCGINLGLYQPGVINLLKKILSQTSVERVALSSVEPDMVTKEFADLFLKEPRLVKYFHLALQSGSPKVLKDMGRKTNLEKLSKILHFIKLKCPEFTFRADILVGFPTETEENFQETLDFIQKNKISFVHTFPFSVRPGTKAEGFIKSGTWKDFPAKIKKERVKKVISLAKKIRIEEGKELKDEILPCLIIKEKEAVANNSWPVKIRIMNNEQRIMEMRRKIVPVKIIGLKDNYLLGEITSFPT